MATVYTLKRKKDTNEMHLFECKDNLIPGKCDCNQVSICGKMNIKEPHIDSFSCVDENNARLGTANKGRDVCGVCVSRLYKTY